MHLFTWNNMLPLVILKDDMEVECYELKLNVEKVLYLKLKVEVVERAQYGLKFVGGQHHHWVMEILRAKLKEVVTGL